MCFFFFQSDSRAPQNSFCMSRGYGYCPAHKKRKGKQPYRNEAKWNWSCEVFTSLNSGLSVFFFTAVLCFDFLFSSGFRYLQEEANTQQNLINNVEPHTHTHTLTLTLDVCLLLYCSVLQGVLWYCPSFNHTDALQCTLSLCVNTVSFNNNKSLKSILLLETSVYFIYPLNLKFNLVVNLKKCLFTAFFWCSHLFRHFGRYSLLNNNCTQQSVWTNENTTILQ